MTFKQWGYAAMVYLKYASYMQKQPHNVKNMRINPRLNPLKYLKKNRNFKM